MKKILLRLVVLVGLLAFAMPCYASLSLYNDSISVGSGGITATSLWNVDSTKLTWEIVDLGNGWVSYKYVWFTDEKNLSHIILQTSGNTTADDFKNYNVTSVEGPELYEKTDPGNSNPQLPGDIFGIKFAPNSGTKNFTLTFLSTRLPMWGNFYAKDGTDREGGVSYDVLAYNTGFGGEPDEHGNFIAVPDTRTPEVPLPGAVWLLGTGLLGLVGVRRRFSK